jgi:hypothetical protein
MIINTTLVYFKKNLGEEWALSHFCRSSRAAVAKTLALLKPLLLPFTQKALQVTLCSLT